MCFCFSSIFFILVYHSAAFSVCHHTFFFFLLTIRYFYCIELNYFVFYCQSQGWSNEDTRATWVRLFHKHLALHLVEGFVKDMPNNESDANDKHVQTNVFITCAGETVSSFTCSPVRAFHLGMGKPARKQAWPVRPGKERSRWMAALAALCQSSLAAAAPGSPKGPRQPGKLSEPRSWWVSESRGWLSGSLSGSHLTERFGRNVQSLPPVGLEPDHAWGLWACSCWSRGSILALRWRLSLQMAAPSSSHWLCSAEGGSASWSEPFFPPLSL